MHRQRDSKLRFTVFNLSGFGKQSERCHAFPHNIFAEILQTEMPLRKGNVNFKFLSQTSYLSQPLNDELTIHTVI